MIKLELETLPGGFELQTLMRKEIIQFTNYTFTSPAAKYEDGIKDWLDRNKIHHTADPTSFTDPSPQKIVFHKLSDAVLFKLSWSDV